MKPEDLTDEDIREFRLALAKEMDSGLLLPRSRVAQGEAIGVVTRAWEDAYAEFKLCELALGRVRNSRRTPGYKAEARTKLCDAINARKREGGR